MNHAERYEYLVNKMAAIRWRGSDLDASYHAALFLMASHPALFQKMDRYLCPEGIDFTKMMRKEEFEYDWMVDHADFLLAVYDNNRKLRSGTGQTVNNALKQNLRIIFLHPDTAEIS